jgi:hypothetical protein
MRFHAGLCKKNSQTGAGSETGISASEKFQPAPQGRDRHFSIIVFSKAAILIALFTALGPPNVQQAKGWCGDDEFVVLLPLVDPSVG